MTKATTSMAAMLLSASTALASLTPVTIKGNAFYNGTDRFYIRGVDYQPGGSSDIADPLADADTCKRDIPYFISLGLNTVRVYTVDNSADHDECMSALEDAGIYLILDVNSPLYSLNRDDPASSYNAHYLQNIFATMDMFAKYDNTLAFFSGNEVINSTAGSTKTAPYIKAVTRDMKQYRDDRQLRTIPIGYSAADVEQNRVQTAEYLNCGTDDERSDFFAFNDYSWCDPSTFQQSGWSDKVETFSNYSLPIFLSEHGCNTNKRTFGDIAALYNTEMTGVYSGGLVYEYSQEASDYGLVQISGSSIDKLSDFSALQKAYAGTQNPSGSGGARSDAGDASDCPASNSNWLVDSDALPAIPDAAKSFMSDGAGKGPGLKGPGSQNAGESSTGTASAGSGQATTTGAATSNDDASSSSSAARPMAQPQENYMVLASFGVVAISALLGATLI